MNMSAIHRVVQEEMSIFWAVAVSVNLRKQVNMDVCLILNGYRDRTVRISSPNYDRFLFMRLDEV